MSEVRIHRATRADAPRLGHLFEQYRAFYGVARDLSAAVRFLGARLSHDESTVFMASVDSPSQAPAPVGFVQLYPSYSSLAMRNTEILNDLFVVPEWRRGGVARLLIAAAIDHARARGAASIELVTQYANAPARALYRTFGFTEDEEFARLCLSLGGQR